MWTFWWWEETVLEAEIQQGSVWMDMLPRKEPLPPKGAKQRAAAGLTTGEWRRENEDHCQVSQICLSCPWPRPQDCRQQYEDRASPPRDCIQGTPNLEGKSKLGCSGSCRHSWKRLRREITQCECSSLSTHTHTLTHTQTHKHTFSHTHTLSLIPIPPWSTTKMLTDRFFNCTIKRTPHLERWTGERYPPCALQSRCVSDEIRYKWSKTRHL